MAKTPTQDEYHGFTEQARQMIRDVRSGKALAGRATKGSVMGAEKAAAQSGGPLPESMFKAARKGKYVK